MNQRAKVILGIAIVAAGVLWVLGVLGLLSINLFFDGWWTLFIIIPCAVGLVTDHDKIGPLLGLSVGAILLLSCQGIIRWDIVWGLCGGACLIALGLSLIFRPFGGSGVRVDLGRVTQDGKNIRTCDISMGRQLVNFDGEVFEGAILKTSFSGVTMDLRNSIINEDVIIKIDCVFCGVDIIVPEDLVVKVAVNSSFGGVKDDHKSNAVDGSPVVYIVGNASFAGVTVK